MRRRSASDAEDEEDAALLASTSTSAATTASASRLRVRVAAVAVRGLAWLAAGTPVSVRVAASAADHCETRAALPSQGGATLACAGEAFLGATANLLALADLCVELRSHANATAAASVVASAKLHLDALLDPSTSNGLSSGWLALCHRGRQCGEVFLRLELLGTLPPPSQPLSPLAAAAAALGVSAAATLRAAVGPARNALRVTVHGCLGLADEGAAARALSPCVRVLVGPASAGGRLEMRTATRTATASPVFGESFLFPSSAVPSVSIIVESSAGALARAVPLAALHFEAADLSSLAVAPSTAVFPLLAAAASKAAERPHGDIELTLAWVSSLLLPPASSPALLAAAPPRRLTKAQADELDGASAAAAPAPQAASPPPPQAQPQALDRHKAPAGVLNGRSEGYVRSDVAELFAGAAPTPGLVAAGGSDGEAEHKRRAAEEAAAEAAAAAAAASVTPLRAGDYTVAVHVIEARNLRGGDSSGTSDPLVVVDLCGKRQHTHVVWQRNSCVFDETLVFDLAGLILAELEAAVVHVSVYNANVVTRNELIGSYSFDLEAIYARPGHEFHCAWVCLIDDSSAETCAAGVQGVLKLSVSALGPGDRPIVHAPGDDPDVSGDSKSSLVRTLLMPPNLERSLKFVVVSVFSCDGLRPMRDRRSALASLVESGPGIDAFVRLSLSSSGGPLAGVPHDPFFAAHSAVTKWVSARGLDNLAVEWSWELWVPMMTPTMTDSVRIELLDHEVIGPPALLGTIQLSFRDIAARPFPAAYVPVYGAPDGLYDESVPAISHMNRFARLASSQRGRMLLGARVEDDSGSEPEKAHCKVIPRLPRALVPLLAPYRVRALIILGDELPAFRATAAGLLTFLGAELGVMVSVGGRSACSPRVRPERGMARFNALLEFDVDLPAQADDASATGRWAGFTSPLPDVFVYLYRGEPPSTAPTSAGTIQRLCFARLETAPLIACGLAGSMPTWLPLREDEALNAVGDNEKTGTLLLRLGIEAMEPPTSASALAFDFKQRKAELDASAAEWREDLASGTTALVPYELRVHCFRGDDLDAADSDGSLDPYLRISIAGVTRRSAVQPKGRAPSFYETVVFPLLLLPAPEHLRLAPQVHVELFDHDRFKADDFVAELSFSLSAPECVVTPSGAAAVAAASPPTPMWYNLSRGASVESNHAAELGASVVTSLVPAASLSSAAHAPANHGRLLLSFELVRRDRDGLSPAQLQQLAYVSAHQQTPLTPQQQVALCVPLCPSIAPPTRAVFLEIIVVGLRGMKHLDGIALHAPSISFDLGDRSRLSQVRSTRSSRSPSGANCNFGERIVLPFSAPLDALFAGCLNVTVLENRFGGLSTPVVGTATVKLEDKLTWSPTFGAARGGALYTSQHPDLAAAAAPPKLTPSSASAAETSLVDEFGVDHSRFLVTGDGATLSASTDSPVLDDNALYMAGRRVYSAGLEDVLGTTPFERFSVMRGQRVGRAFSTLDNRQSAGTLKALVRVVPSLDAVPLLDVQDLRTPQPVIARVYVLTGHDLVSQEMLSTSSDPYIILRLGGVVVSGSRDRFIKGSNSPEFFSVFEVRATLPGPSELSVEVWDHEMVGPLADEFVGRTVVDLEDRWFERSWRAIGKEHETPSRLRPKPVETRTLWSPKSRAPQGALRLWVDILSLQQAARFPAVKIAPPPPLEYEVRVLVFSSRKVDTSRGSDLFVRAQLRSCREQETDTHWHCDDGAASWNWRLQFPVQLPLGLRFPYLTLQLLDRDVAKYNNFIGEAVLDLGHHFKRALAKKGEAIQAFETSPEVVGKARFEAAARRARWGASLGAGSASASAPASSASAVAGLADSGDEESASPTDTGARAGLVSASSVRKGRKKGRRRANSASATAEDGLDASAAAAANPLALLTGDVRDVEDEVDMIGVLAHLREFKKSVGAIEYVAVPRHAQFVPVVRAAGIKDGADKAQPHGAGLAGAATALAASGASPAAGSGEQHEVGELLVGIEILPRSVAERYPAGLGRCEPNAYPALPAPHGRVGFISFSPSKALRGLLGSRAFLALAFSTLSAGGLSALIFGLPFIESATTLMKSLPTSVVTAVWCLVAFLVLAVLCCCCAGPRCCGRALKPHRVEVEVFGSASEIIGGEGAVPSPAAAAGAAAAAAKAR